MRVLLSALSCNPDLGSEALVGYRYAETLAGQHALDVVAAPPAKAPAGATLHLVSAGRCSFNDVSPQALLRFEMRQLPVAWRLQRRHHFDVIHRVTPASIRRPSFLWKLGAPFVIGPLLASDLPPESFEPYLRRAEGAGATPKYRPGRIAAGIARRLLDSACDRHVHLKWAQRILVGTEVAMRHVPRLYRHRCVLIPYCGVKHELFVPPVGRPTDRPPIFLFVGRIEQYKGVELLLRAAALACRKCDFRLRILGSGDDAYVRYCHDLADDLGLRQTVEFLRPISYAELPQVYREADVFCFPTICDTYGIALLEAMSSECAALVSDVAGPREIVSESTGVKVPMHDPRQYIGEYAEAMVGLANDPARRSRLGQAARQRILTYHDWTKISQQLLSVYEQV